MGIYVIMFFVIFVCLEVIVFLWKFVLIILMFFLIFELVKVLNMYYDMFCIFWVDSFDVCFKVFVWCFWFGGVRLYMILWNGMLLVLIYGMMGVIWGCCFLICIGYVFEVVNERFYGVEFCFFVIWMLIKNCLMKWLKLF